MDLASLEVTSLDLKHPEREECKIPWEIKAAFRNARILDQSLEPIAP
jgi:hypothetical protein